nr:receptor-type tyrosine-protein phosphatase F isoform X5 [Hydra vulgaris]
MSKVRFEPGIKDREGHYTRGRYLIVVKTLSQLNNSETQTLTNKAAARRNKLSAVLPGMWWGSNFKPLAHETTQLTLFAVGLTFSVEPNLSYIKTGASFNLTCVTEQSATWMFNGNIFYPELNTSYFFKNNTSVNDSGSYSCSDGNYSVTINITVLEALPKPLLILNNKSVWSGSSISGICNVLLNSNISYNFFHNNETVHNASSLNEFNLSNLTSERSGYYSCSVSINGFEPTFSDPVNLIVQILVTVQNQTYQENVDANMTCVTPSSEKISNYNWFFENKLRYSSNTSNTLTIKNLSRTDAGNYLCQIITAGGVTANSTGNLDVQYQDTPAFTNLDPNPVEGTNVTFNCTTNANVNLTYQLFKNNVLIANTSYYVIYNIQRTDSGQYNCTSSSSGNQFSKTFFQDVNVLYQDTPSFTNLDPNPVEGTNVTLNCTTNANVNLTYQIFKNNVSIANTSYYVIQNIQRTDSGQYSCMSSSSRTQVSKTFFQEVKVLYQDTPSFTNLDPNPVEGTNVTLNCTTNANVNLTYQIFKNNVSFFNASYYVVQNIQRTDSGQYSCMSSSSRTQVSKTFFQEVKVLCLTFGVEPNLSHIKTGTSFNLTCVTEGNATWMLNGNIIYPELNTNYYFKNNVSVNDSGSYSCSDGNSSVTINITVLDALPKPQLILNNIPVWSGSNISGICNFSLISKNVFYKFYCNNETEESESSLNEFNLSNLSSENSGDYSCSASINGFEPTFSDPVNVIVQILVTVQNQTYQENVDANMTCVTPSSEKISNYNWFFENKLRYSSNTSNTLTIKNVSRTDAGNYLCQIITSESVTANSTGNLDVLYQDPPFFTNLDPNPVEGTNVTLNCTTNANVNLTYQIFKNNVLIANTSYYIIHNIQRTGSGQYNCTSSSSGNQFSKTTVQDVNVLYQDTPFFTNLDPNPVEGTNVTFNCTTNANVNLTYQIFKSNVSIANTSYYVFPNIQRTDSVQYSCTSSSSRTQVSKTFFQDIKVLYPPNALYFSNNISNVVNVKITQNFTVQCCTTDLGLPNANLSWYSEGKENLNTILSNNCISLSIVQISRNSSGRYTCYANSSLNVANKSMDLTVQEVPDSPILLANITTFMSIWLQWLSQFTGNDPIINYTLSYQINGSLITPHIISLKDTMYNITGLNAFSIYRIDIKAVNSIGESQSTTIYIQTNETVPNNVKNFSWIASERSGLVIWDPPDHIYGELKGYTVSYKKPDDSNFIYSSGCSQIKTRECNISNLTPYTKYEIRIMVENKQFSNYSVNFGITSTAAPPPFNDPLPEVLNSDITKNSFKIRLVSFSNIYGPIRNYNIVVRKLPSSSLPSTSSNSYSDADISSYKDGLYLAGTVTGNATEFVVGSGVTSKRKRKSSIAQNPALDSGTYYTVFIRGYMSVFLILAQNPALDSGTYYTVFIRGYVSDDKYQTTNYYPPVKTQANTNAISPGIIAAIVVPIGCAIIIIFLVILFICCRRKNVEKIPNESPTLKPIKTISPIGIDRYEPIAPKNFEDHVNRLKANGNYGFSQEYGMINRDLAYSYSCSRLQENNIKNRYHNVPAYDTTRVVLHVIDNDPSSDYINANYVEGFESDYEYIATQGPLPETVFDFWRMVWETDSMTIVMLTRLEEKGRVKCAQYWPETGCLSVKDIVITTTEINEFSDHVIRTFHVTRTGQAVERLVKQFHFTAWPDFGVPNDPSTLLSFIRKVNKWKENNIVQRAIVHCSAGVGRTGTYITIDTQIKQIKKKQEISIYANVSRIREQRCLLVQTEDQYIFIHNVLLDYIDSGETEIEASELRDYFRKSQVSESGMTELMSEFIRLAKSEKKDQFNAANRPINQAKNRFKNIYPYDDTRVKLTQKPGVDGSDYINANHVDSYACKDFFIATQAPLESTVGDFWRMVWEQKCGAIVMISKEKEGGQIKVHPYWPTKISLKIECFIIELTTETTYGDYIVRELKLTNTDAGKSYDLKHFQFTTWPETGSPESGIGMIELIGQVQRWNIATSNKCTVVHCSAGVGRTGVFIALTNLIERVKVEGLVDVFQTVKKLRYQRTAMVQTKDQYEFCYRALQEYLDSFDLYANFR